MAQRNRCSFCPQLTTRVCEFEPDWGGEECSSSPWLVETYFVGAVNVGLVTDVPPSEVSQALIDLLAGRTGCSRAKG